MERRFPSNQSIAAVNAMEIRKQIAQFEPRPNEAFHSIWDRYNNLLDQCPRHGIEDHELMVRFYESLHTFHKCSVDDYTYGAIDCMCPSQLKTIYEKLANVSHERDARRRARIINKEKCTLELMDGNKELRRKQQSHLHEESLTIQRSASLRYKNDCPKEQVFESVSYIGVYEENPAKNFSIARRIQQPNQLI